MWLPTVRDIAIILLAVESLIIGGLLVALTWQIWRLVRMLETEIKPLLDSANDTMNTMRGTTDFVSENVVDPVVRIHSLIAGVKGGINALFKPMRARGAEKEPAPDPGPLTDSNEPQT